MQRVEHLGQGEAVDMIKKGIELLAASVGTEKGSIEAFLVDQLTQLGYLRFKAEFVIATSSEHNQIDKSKALSEMEDELSEILPLIDSVAIAAGC